MSTPGRKVELYSRHVSPAFDKSLKVKSSKPLVEQQTLATETAMIEIDGNTKQISDFSTFEPSDRLLKALL